MPGEGGSDRIEIFRKFHLLLSSVLQYFHLSHNILLITGGVMANNLLDNNIRRPSIERGCTTRKTFFSKRRHSFFQVGRPLGAKWPPVKMTTVG